MMSDKAEIKPAPHLRRGITTASGAYVPGHLLSDIDFIDEVGGVLTYTGAWWVGPNYPSDSRVVYRREGEWLVALGIAEFTRFAEGQMFRTPIELRLISKPEEKKA